MDLNRLADYSLKKVHAESRYARFRLWLATFLVLAWPIFIGYCSTKTKEGATFGVHLTFYLGATAAEIVFISIAVVFLQQWRKFRAFFAAKSLNR